MNDDTQMTIDREAVAAVWREQFAEANRKHIADGTVTAAEAAEVLRRLMASALVQRLIDDNVALLQAHLDGRVH